MCKYAKTNNFVDVQICKRKAERKWKMHCCISKVHMQVSKYSKRRKPSDHEKGNKTRAIPKI